MLARQSAIRENKRNPGKAVHLNQIGWASHNIGAAKFSQKKYNEASERFEESIIARTEALAAQPGNFDLVKSIAESQLMAASCFMVLKRPEEARIAYRSAIQNLEKLTEDQPGNPEALVSAAVAYLNLSNLNANSGKLKNAIENCTKGIQLIEPFIKVEPKHRLARTELAKLYANRAIFNHHGLFLDQAVMDCKKAIRHAPSGNIEQTCQTLLVGYLIEQENFQLAAETAMEIDNRQWIPYYRFLLLKSMARLLNRADQDQNLLKDPDQRNLQQAADVLYESLEKERYFQKSSGAKDRLFEIRKFGLPG